MDEQGIDDSGFSEVADALLQPVGDAENFAEAVENNDRGEEEQKNVSVRPHERGYTLQVRPGQGKIHLARSDVRLASALRIKKEGQG